MMAGAVCNPVSLPVSLPAAFLVGLAGSLHCVAMCGSISGALGLRARRGPKGGAAWKASLSHQIGRITSYSLAGAVVGACSSVLLAFVDMNRLALWIRVGAGLLLIAIATNILFKWKSLAPVERIGATLWRRLAPLGSRISPHTAGGPLFLGMLWGWLPCGFVYSVLIFAALQGGALQGAALMFCFGLGTLPALLGAGVLGSTVGPLGGITRLHNVSGWVLLFFGVVTMAGPFARLHH